jgi:hypothetical protein
MKFSLLVITAVLLLFLFPLTDEILSDSRNLSVLEIYFEKYNTPPFTHYIRVKIKNEAPDIARFDAWCEYRCQSAPLRSGKLQIVYGAYLGGYAERIYANPFQLQCTEGVLYPPLPMLCYIEFKDGFKTQFKAHLNN